jgi:DNA-directed RNA polymerase sigma subunit (sigma70/sigma32)
VKHQYNEREDFEQEYFCSRLEGLDHEAAMKRARRMSRRVVAIGSYDVRYLDHMVAEDFTFGETREWEPMTLDTRTDEEREVSWDRSDRAGRVWSFCTPRQREILSAYFGLESGERPTMRDIGRQFGISHQRVAAIIRAAQNNASSQERSVA